MKKLYILAAVIMLSFIIGGIKCEAASEGREEKFEMKTLVEYKEMFSGMTDEELNEYIDSCMERASTGISLYASIDAIGSAWLAAAEIAANNGYPCAAKIIECSVWGQAYIEENVLNQSGMFYNKIINTSIYQQTRASIVGSGTSSFAFKKVHSADLFYAIHRCNIEVISMNSSNVLFPGADQVIITDTFDFAYDNTYDSTFTSLVNNWAWLCQNSGSLHVIPVRIVFYD